MGAAVVLDTLLLLDGFGRGQATRYISQDPRKRSQFCYGGLQVGIFTLWLFSVCVCVCVCLCLCVCENGHSDDGAEGKRGHWHTGSGKMGERRNIMREV